MESNRRFGTRVRNAAGAAAVASVLLSAPPALATIVWDNGDAVELNGRCIGADTSSCSADVQLFDDFELVSFATIRRVTFDVDLNQNGAFYDSAIITIWNSNPSTHYALGHDSAYGGAGSLSNRGNGITRITFSDEAGIFSRGPGIYWIGMRVLINPLQSNGPGGTWTAQEQLGPSYQISDGGNFNMSFDRDLAFTLSTTVPEPASWALLIMGFGVVGGAMRLRRIAVI